MFRKTLGPAKRSRSRSAARRARCRAQRIAHLAGLVGSSVKVTLEINAEIAAGAPEQIVRDVTENSRTRKFTTHGFEHE